MNQYTSYTVKVQATTAEGTETCSVNVYASCDAEAGEFAKDEIGGWYRSRVVALDVVEIIRQRNRL